MVIFTMPLMERINNVFKRKEEVNDSNCYWRFLHNLGLPDGNQERP